MQNKPPVPARVYRIEIVVSDENIDGNKLNTLIAQAGEVREVQMMGFAIPKHSY